MATVTRKTDANRNRTTDTFVDGKKYHYFKGDPLLENFIIVQHPSGLTVKRSANGSHPDVLEQQRIDVDADFVDNGFFTAAERRDWNKAIFWAHIVLPGMRDFLDNSATDVWDNARQDDGAAAAMNAYGIGWTDAKLLNADVRTTHESTAGNERSSTPGGTFDPSPEKFWADRSVALTSAKEIRQLSLYSNSVLANFNLKIVERTSEDTYDVVLESGDLAHGGSGWEHFDVRVFQVPATGTFYVGVWLPEAVTLIDRNTGTSRLRTTTQPTGADNTINETTGHCPAVGVRFQKDFPHPSDMGFGAADVPGKFRKIFEALG